MTLGYEGGNPNNRNMLRARVLTFHTESEQIGDVVQALDAVGERVAGNPDFRGLICLDHTNQRHELVVITMWDGNGPEETGSDDDDARRQIAEICDLGVRSQEYEVLRHFPASVYGHQSNLRELAASISMIDS